MRNENGEETFEWGSDAISAFSGILEKLLNLLPFQVSSSRNRLYVSNRRRSTGSEKRFPARYEHGINRGNAFDHFLHTRIVVELSL
jgi:hypothetical protein